MMKVNSLAIDVLFDNDAIVVEFIDWSAQADFTLFGTFHPHVCVCFSDLQAEELPIGVATGNGRPRRCDLRPGRETPNRHQPSPRSKPSGKHILYTQGEHRGNTGGLLKRKSLSSMFPSRDNFHSSCVT